MHASMSALKIQWTERQDVGFLAAATTQSL